MLPADPIACPLARHVVRWMLTWWRLGHALEVAELLSAEIVTNAVAMSMASGRTSGGLVGVELRLTMTDSRLLIEVADPDPSPPVPRDAGPDDENGRGLLLVEALADRWGHLVLTCADAAVGKVVWCEVGLCAPTTPAGLPLRTVDPLAVPGRGRRGSAEPDLAVLRRVRDRLHRL
nr:ATP-binding protein [Pseudofrankia sp. BMG5.36]